MSMVGLESTLSKNIMHYFLCQLRTTEHLTTAPFFSILLNFLNCFIFAVSNLYVNVALLTLKVPQIIQNSCSLQQSYLTKAALVHIYPQQDCLLCWLLATKTIRNEEIC